MVGEGLCFWVCDTIVLGLSLLLVHEPHGVLIRSCDISRHGCDLRISTKFSGTLHDFVCDFSRHLTTSHDMDAESAEVLNMFKTVRHRCDFLRIATTSRFATTSHDLPLHTVRLCTVTNGVVRHRSSDDISLKAKNKQFRSEIPPSIFSSSIDVDSLKL
ncbi:hypothetical protein HOLleu_24994 [Holothuria leucospilota]|uniref:Secreted protein n=1 Tax=Holothuria leucospilota TaxID=206669 RepID=A0A9Q1BRG1_HOLLE|nr:hypothetical protein HOLleu_24994 [Holothuria leucospilota]